MFLGSRDDVADILRASNVFAFPSRYEGFPGAIVEALATGIPVVASRIPMHEEAIDDGESGLLVPLAKKDENEGDRIEAEAWASALDSAASQETSVRLAFAGRKRAESRYSIEAVADAHVALYRSLLNRRSPSGAGSRS